MVDYWTVELKDQGLNPAVSRDIIRSLDCKDLLNSVGSRGVIRTISVSSQYARAMVAAPVVDYWTLETKFPGFESGWEQESNKNCLNIKSICVGYCGS